MSNNREKSQQGKTIRVGDATSDRLDKLRHKGQSYDGLITELLDIYESNEIEDHITRSPKKKKRKSDRIQRPS